MGFDAEIVHQVERRSAKSSFKRYAAHPIFFLATFDTWFRYYDHSRPRFDIHLADGEVIDDCILAIVSNTTPYTYFGSRPIVVAPDANLDRPLFLTAFRSRHALTITRVGVSALASGRLLAHHRSVAHRRDLTSFTVVGHGPFPWQADGDYLGEVERLPFTWMPEALRLVVP